MKCIQYPTETVLLSKVAPNDFFKRKLDAKKVYVKGPYDRTTKSFECHDSEDAMYTIFIKANKSVFVNFTY